MKWMVPILVVLAACVPPEVADDVAPDPAPDIAGDDPDADAVATVESSTRAVAAACLSDAQKDLPGKTLAEARGAIPPEARIIAPGELFTQDYLPNRMNVDINAKSVITRVWCG